MRSNTDSIVDTGDQRIIETSLPKADTIGSHSGGFSTAIWDRLGIAGSLLCVLHCALTPLLIGYLSAMGLGILGDEIIHKVLALLLLAVAVVAFVPGYKKHANTAVVAAGSVGVALIVAGGLVLAPFIGHDLEIGLTVAGSLFLVGAHTANWRLTSCSASDCSNQCTEH